MERVYLGGSISLLLSLSPSQLAMAQHPSIDRLVLHDYTSFTVRMVVAAPRLLDINQQEGNERPHLGEGRDLLASRAWYGFVDCFDVVINPSRTYGSDLIVLPYTQGRLSFEGDDTLFYALLHLKTGTLIHPRKRIDRVDGLWDSDEIAVWPLRDDMPPPARVVSHFYAIGVNSPKWDKTCMRFARAINEKHHENCHSWL